MKKIITLFLCFCVALQLTACGKTKNKDNNQNTNTNSETQKTVDDKGFQVIFFDIENSSDGNTHYDGDNNDKTWGYLGAKPADCYMIKTGNIEILVDAGIQLNVTNKRTARIYQENVIKKIEQYCSDDMIDYLIVTHGDSDHLSGLAVEGGIFDYCLNNNLQIGKIIDFDSELVRNLCSKNEIPTSEYNKLIDSVIVDDYRKKRTQLVEEKGTIHIPAASLFNGMSFLDENPMTTAMPDNYYYSHYLSTTDITGFYYFSNDVSDGTNNKNVLIHYIGDSEGIKEDNLEYKSYYPNLNLGFGTLENENERFYYSIDLGNSVELRILYNWFYDHIFVHKFDSQNRNNISVCFEIVCGDNEFMSFGDLGGLGENSLIKYYSDTSILSDIDCFKASHHGSTVNGENSADLFRLLKPDIVIVPGVAQLSKKMLEQRNMNNDPIYSGISGTSCMEEDFFSNVRIGRSDTKIYCTQILGSLDIQNNYKFISAPFYGDITINFIKNKWELDCTYKGEVDSYISKEHNHYKFVNTKDNHILSYDETDHYKAVYQNN